MGQSLIVETSFLVDLEREPNRGTLGRAYHMPIVTRNVEHYRRVPGLEVETY